MAEHKMITTEHVADLVLWAGQAQLCWDPYAGRMRLVPSHLHHDQHYMDEVCTMAEVSYIATKYGTMNEGLDCGATAYWLNRTYGLIEPETGLPWE